MRVPTLGPGLCVVIDAREEEVVEEPDVELVVAVETVFSLEREEEVAPCRTKPLRDVDPQALDAGIVNRSVSMSSRKRNASLQTHGPQMYEPRP